LGESPHPLARELAAQLLRRQAGSRRTLLLGLGSGRNVPPLLASRAALTIVDEDPARACAVLAQFGSDGRPAVFRGGYADLGLLGTRFDAALSTHAFLHGKAADVLAGVAGLSSLLVPGALCYLTLGSTADPRFGCGTGLDARTWAAIDGPEAGVPHAYFDREQARAAFVPFASVEIAEGHGAAGTWAHDPLETGRIVHWFIRAVAR
jgi:hypothetical protein